MIQRLFRFSFYLLFILTPLFFTRYNNELFEFNKMLLTYALTSVIVGCWLWRMLDIKKLIFQKTILDIPLLIFLISQILSTIFSIDPHTSIWGYYSRLNGGLLSIVSYLLLYWAFVSNFDRAEAFKMLKAALIGGGLVALWAIPEHFGFSPSCALLVGRFSADCWVQDVQSRVFASIGQPNWLAAYMGMLIFPSIYFFLTERTPAKKISYFLLTAALYLAFTFTFSRGGMLGLIGGLLVSILLVGLSFKNHLSALNHWLRPFGVMMAALLAINLLFGSALTGSFRLIKENAPPPRPGITSGGGTQLENGGTESGQIRLIVWQGAIDVFRHYPVFGSGVETFAYSYYLYRPVAHNLVSEWDFLYNKAHNEYLNYLANTGLIGFISYMSFIVIFGAWSLLAVLGKTVHKTGSKLSLAASKLTFNPQEKLLIALMAGGYLSYLIQNFFGFSVVMIAILFYLFPAMVFSVVLDTPNQYYQFKWLQFFNAIYKRNLYSQLLKGVIVIFTLYLLWSVLSLWRADANYKLGSDASDAGNANRAYTAFRRAYQLNSAEPLYQSDFGNILASAAVALADTDATGSADLKNDALVFTKNALQSSPANVSLWRTAIRTYYTLSVIDPDFDQKTIETIDTAISKAPTDPKLYYNKALILSQQQKLPEAIETINQAITLKPNYREAKISLAELYIKNKQPEQAVETITQVLKAIPNDPDALKVLQEATESAQ
jgi:O-antigen ligase/tetratricopeptide (TPR) repeat protein